MTKRTIDIVVSLVGLVTHLPLLAAVALLVKATSPGPVLYSQMRVGRKGREFRLYKFRSMIREADTVGGSATAKNDPRITPVGRLLRKLKLDELPQLWNVLVGDMSLVGPRPEVPEIVRYYTPKMRQVLDVRPGITSHVSLVLRDEEHLLSLAANPDDAYIRLFVPFKIALALDTVRRISLIEDVSLIVRTVWSLVIHRWIVGTDTAVVTTLKDLVRQYNHDRPDVAGTPLDQSWKRLPGSVVAAIE
jgi:lipopolysaccharide/colanic/teichoic acid biosynthesis glycosyltransferase